jgi:hypothetical protein
MISAAFARAIVVAGSSSRDQPSSVNTLSAIGPTCTVAPRPLAGSQPRKTANTMMSIRPTQKFGSEKPSIEPVMMPRVLTACGFRPAQMPNGTPTMTDSSIATVASSSVAGMRSRINPIAGWPARKLLPKSRRSACSMKIPYCWMSGWSRPKLWRIAARSSSVASGLAIIEIGSPMT